MNFKTTDIPPSFLDSTEKKPFSHCVECDRELLKSGENYLIQKTYRGDQVTFEFALCMDCSMRFHEEMSKESREKMTEFFQKEVNMQLRRERYENAETANDYLEYCVVCERSKAECPSHSDMTILQGSQLILSEGTMMICSDCEERYNELLSDKTRDFLDNFTDRHFGVPPEFEDLFKPRPVFV